MSEYQYYEFLAVDRPLDKAAQTALRTISTRARITATHFVNSYEWGDLKADPRELLKRYFDLFIYVANWGSRRFALRVPERLVDLDTLDRFGLDDDIVSLKVTGENLIIDISCDEIEADDWDDGSGWIASLAPLRTDLLGGDFRLFVLLWLMQVENDLIEDEAAMPSPGLGTMNAALSSLATFLDISSDLLEAASHLAPAELPQPSSSDAETAIRALPENEKIDLLLRVYNHDPLVGAELRRLCQKPSVNAGGDFPTAGELRAAAANIQAERRQADAKRAADERRKREQELAEAREKHLAALANRGKAVWNEVEELIELRNAAGYDRATALLVDLGEIAVKAGTQNLFAQCLAEIRTRHERKGKFIERLAKAKL